MHRQMHHHLHHQQDHQQHMHHAHTRRSVMAGEHRRTHARNHTFSSLHFNDRVEIRARRAVTAASAHLRQVSEAAMHLSPQSLGSDLFQKLSANSRLSSIMRGGIETATRRHQVLPSTKSAEHDGDDLSVLFDIIDADKSGTISVHELAHFLHGHGTLLPNDYNTLQELIDTKFGTKGEDESNREQMTRQEFKTWLQKLNIFPNTDVAGKESQESGEKASLVRKDSSIQCDAIVGGSEKVRRYTRLHHGSFNQQLGTVPWYIIEPDKPRHLAWDFIILTMLAYTMTVTPVRLGFDIASVPMSPDFFIETFIDLMFCLDVGINFFTAYMREDGALVHDLQDIARHYTSTWFLCDIVSSIPFDLLAFLANPHSSGSDIEYARTAKALKGGRLMKVLRLLKLSKMLRLVRAYKVSQRLEEELDLVGRVNVKIAKIALSTLFMSHLFACGWAGMARINGERDYYQNSWSSMWGSTDSGFTYEYLSALYWAVTTLTTVGYGDISPRSSGEIIFAALAMIIGGAFYGYIIAMLAAMMQGVDANARIYHMRMDSISSYMRHRNFPKLLFRKVSRFYHHYYKYKTAFDEDSILAGLSKTLQNDVARFLAQDIFSKSYILNGLKDIALMRLLHALIPVKSSMNEVIFKLGDPGDEMFFITMGNVFAFDNNGNLLLEYDSGGVFGEFAALGLLAGRMYHTQCRDMVEMCSITKSDLECALMEHPEKLQEIKDRAKDALKDLLAKLGKKNSEKLGNTMYSRAKALRLLQHRRTKVQEKVADGAHQYPPVAVRGVSAHSPAAGIEEKNPMERLTNASSMIHGPDTMCRSVHSPVALRGTLQGLRNRICRNGISGSNPDANTSTEEGHGIGVQALYMLGHQVDSLQGSMISMKASQEKMQQSILQSEAAHKKVQAEILQQLRVLTAAVGDVGSSAPATKARPGD